MKLNTDSRIPLYYQLLDVIEEKIRSEAWPRGEKIPAERELCEMYGVSRITVRKAIEELTRSGKLKRIQGKGTFVAEHPITQQLGMVYSFSQEMEKQGKISSTKVLDIEIIAADDKLADRLNIEQGEQVIVLKRLRLADDQPIMYERTYFKKQRYEKLLEVDFNKVGLYKTLELEFGIKSTRAEERFRACELTINEAELLHAKPFSYGLVVQRTLYADDEIVSWSSLVSKGDSFEFKVVLNTL